MYIRCGLLAAGHRLQLPVREGAALTADRFPHGIIEAFLAAY
jgi:hypothetical protein